MIKLKKNGPSGEKDNERFQFSGSISVLADEVA